MPVPPTEEEVLAEQAEAKRDQLELVMAMWRGMMDMFGLPAPPDDVWQAVGILRAKREELAEAASESIKADVRAPSDLTGNALIAAQMKLSNYEGHKQELMFFFGDMQSAAEVWKLKDYLA
jgi:hypothetical protein